NDENLALMQSWMWFPESVFHALDGLARHLVRLTHGKIRLRGSRDNGKILLRFMALRQVRSFHTQFLFEYCLKLLDHRVANPQILGKLLESGKGLRAWTHFMVGLPTLRAH